MTAQKRLTSRLLLRLLLLVIPALACQVTGTPNTLPPTDTPAAAGPTPVPTAGNNGFFVLNLTQSDADGLQKRADQIYQDLINTGGEVSRTVLLDAYASLAKYKHVGGQWNPVGPGPIQGVYMPQGQVPGSGRVDGFAVDPRNSNVVYAAISIGGIWKTTDGGQTWTSLTSNQVPLVYGGIVMDPKNPDTLYAPLGEMSGTVGQTYGFLADGIMRTHDAGKTWQLIGANEFLGASVTSLVIAPDGKLYASSGQIEIFHAPDNMPDFGIFSSADGGDTWQRLVSCDNLGNCDPPPNVDHPSRNGGFFDLQVGGDGTLYTSLCIYQCSSTALYRSQDGGQSWQPLDISQALAAWLKANPDRGQIAHYNKDPNRPGLNSFSIAVSATDPKILLAGGGIYTVDQKNTVLNNSWVIRSADGGDTWEWLPKAGDYCTGSGHNMQCYYDNIIRIDPTNAKVMYVGGSFVVDPSISNDPWVSVVERSDDGGDTWTDLTPVVQGSFMHPDMHALTIDPNDPTVLWVGNDGGVYHTSDVTAQPPTWDTLSNGLNTVLAVDVALHPTDPNYLLVGMQDNARATTTDRKTWQGTAQGDGAFVAVDPFKPKTVYGTMYPNNIFQRNTAGGVGPFAAWAPPNQGGYTAGLGQQCDTCPDHWPFYPPFAVDPNNEGVLYLASNRIYRTSNRGDKWAPVSSFLNKTPDGQFQCLVVAPSDSNTIYAGMTEGTVFASTDGSKTWAEITGSNFPARIVNGLAVDPNDPMTVYAAFGGFNVQSPDNPGHIFVSHDGGGSWDDISYNLPDVPLGSVVVDTRDQYAGVYVGGALGVWVLQKGSQNWLPYGTAMPISIVTSLKLNPTTGVMAAATFGQSVWVLDML